MCPSYEHFCGNCNEEFEDEYSIKADPPTKCPLCNAEGKVVRLISGGSGKGIVELSGQELKQSLKAAGKALKRTAYSNENLRANLIGEEKYHRQESQLDHIAKEIKHERPSFRR